VRWLENKFDGDLHNIIKLKRSIAPKAAIVKENPAPPEININLIGKECLIWKYFICTGLFEKS